MKYYKIPVTHRMIKMNGRSLFKILKEFYPELYQRELERVELTYGGDEPGSMTPQLEMALEKFQSQTDEMYLELGVPKFIIGFETDDGQILESNTRTPMTTNHKIDNIFQVYEVSRDEALNAINEERNYQDATAQMYSAPEPEKTFYKKFIDKFLGKRS